MSTIQYLPAYARPEAEAFKTTGHLSGDNVDRKPIPAGAVREAERQLTEQLDQLIQIDESPLDLARNEPGKVQIEEMGMQATAHFEGDLQNGEMTLEAHGPMETAAYANFTADAANIVQVLDLGNGEYATIGAHFDRKTPGNSFIELKNVPDDFNIFAG
ncbi:MAG: hypothetical protein FJX76_08440 [Armatimonadetes bacterium]|nr:hypothetical protein [Armatimonadota bacterium]